MNKLVLPGLACGLILALPDPCNGHGGQYRGPTDIVPPGSGSGGGRTPGPRSPTTPGPSAPRTPGPGQPNTPGGAGPVTPGAGPGGTGSGGARSSRGGVPIGHDLTRWQHWWEFNKDPFVRLRDAIHLGAAHTGSDTVFMGHSRRAEAIDSMKPSPSDIIRRVLPPLKRALDTTDQRDIVSSCLLALAKAGVDHPDFGILPLMRERLSSHDQEIRETAALAMGISQRSEAVDDLIALARDTARGRALCVRSSVDNRTAAFACYALGLVAHAANDVALKRRSFSALADVLDETTARGVSDRNLPVAAINGIRLIRPNPDGSNRDRQLLEDCIRTLWTYYGKKTGQGEQLIQAHVPPAIAQLLGRGGDREGTFRTAFARELGGTRRANVIRQSAALALGQLCLPPEVSPGDKRHCELLARYFATGKDQQTRYFCLMSLGLIGGTSNRNTLLGILSTGKKATEKPWAALALGTLAFREAQSSKGSPVTDATIGRALLRELRTNKNGQTRSAIAVALGLAGYREAGPDLEDLLLDNRQRDEVAGYLCIGLALMQHRSSMEVIRSLARTALRRPVLLRQSAIALGKMGDKTVTIDLQEMLLDERNQNVAKLSAVASALGVIGDRRTIEPLADLLHDTSITDLSRAFAAVALGGVADKEPLPWNSKIAFGMNYRAAVETLTNQQSGVLDIL